MTAAFGLSPEALIKIKAVFDGYPQVDRVRVFGSRALGRHRTGSDLDLAVDGTNLGLNDLLELHLRLDNLLLPYKFDLVAFAQISEPSLREHIERAGVTLFERKTSSTPFG